MPVLRFGGLGRSGKYPRRATRKLTQYRLSRAHAALTDLRGYAGQRRFRMVELDAGPKPEEAPVQVEPIANAERALGELSIGTGHLELARKLYRKLARAKAESPETEGKMGLLALKLDREEDARLHRRRAIELVSRVAEIWSRLARITPRPIFCSD